MSLDRWLKSEKPKKPKNKSRLTSKIIQSEEISKKEPKILKKYILICKKTKCNYKKTIVKKMLTDKDKLCPKCGEQMTIKNIS